ncbi:MAG TPA: aminomethyl-transferring glycine dehydrogenase [Vicinamibacterales bacterium]|nr:aminomethyl-transferring glycine dehydrogenase [Vicinamibacterales bacterium]
MHIDAAGRFARRHIGPRSVDLDRMLATVHANSLDGLIDEAIPSGIRLSESMDLPEAEDEHQCLTRLQAIAATNQNFRSFLGTGYYGCVTPAVILRNVLENPSWYTPYTPYQAEIAQGRLEALLNFQTMATDLTGMEVANASLLDEATAGAEAMAMLHRMNTRQANRFLVSRNCYPQTIDVISGRAEPIGIEIEIVDVEAIDISEDVFGLLLQYPDNSGAVMSLDVVIDRAHAAGAKVAVASDLLALTLLRPPGEMGADVVIGNSQRYGVPQGYGGPHAAFLATREKYVRQMPGRVIGVSVDRNGGLAYRMALQTREQHIRREKATSNICTAQALLANIAGFYAVYHGPDGLIEIARRVHSLAHRLAVTLESLGCEQQNVEFFDTLRISSAGPKIANRIALAAQNSKLNFRYFENDDIGIALDETTTDADVDDIVAVFSESVGQGVVGRNRVELASMPRYSEAIARRTAFLTHPVFHKHQSETEMMRYLKRLERRDIGLDTSMIPLGSCTMKLNAAASMIPVSWKSIGGVHPFVPIEQAKGYTQIFSELESALRVITGLDAVSLQPNSGAQGEFAGLMVVRAYHRRRGEEGRSVVLIPSSAHGTNPASAAMAGMRVVVVGCDSQGNVDMEDLRSKAMKHSDSLCALMITYPSTYGVFEQKIREICKIVHEHGGQVYMDGANMNAQVGLTSPAAIGADVCHLNLHKTFAIPHGGGGPGMGPIAVAKHLAPYLPQHSFIQNKSKDSIPSVTAAPWGSASILAISYAYIRMLGAEGLTDASRYAILNANYLKARLETQYDVLYSLPNGRVAHELILDLRPFRESAGIDEQDVAKRLIDYGFHAPTVSFPVPGTMMVEPTESEPLEELDRFCEALIGIRKEIQEIVDGVAGQEDNVLKNAPHTAVMVASDTWAHSYSREKAAFPKSFVRANKFWPSVGRIDNSHGDRNLICSCPPIEMWVDSD